MKYGVLAVLVTVILFAATAMAEETTGPGLEPDDMAIYSLKGTDSRPEFTRPPFETFKTDARLLKFLEYFSKLEYGIESAPCLHEHETPAPRQAIVTRFKLFEKPIYLTFSISE